MNIDDLIAIDIHTHAEEPCCGTRDDGYDAFQAGMAQYFKNPAGADGMLPTVPQTAAYFRERRIGAVIFPVDAERETGFRRYSNEEVAQLCAENDDILIPFASVDPHKGKAGAREVRRLVRDFGVKGFKFHPTMQGFFSQRPGGLLRRAGGLRRGRRHHPVSHRTDGRGCGHARRYGNAAEIFQPDAP